MATILFQSIKYSKYDTIAVDWEKERARQARLPYSENANRNSCARKAIFMYYSIVHITKNETILGAYPLCYVLIVCFTLFYERFLLSHFRYMVQQSTDIARTGAFREYLYGIALLKLMALTRVFSVFKLRLFRFEP